MFRLFVVDVMHEVELGVFKSLFTHLVRMAHVMGKDTVQELNERSVHSLIITPTA